jgi:hypothetical protein
VHDKQTLTSANIDALLRSDGMDGEPRYLVGQPSAFSGIDLPGCTIYESHYMPPGMICVMTESEVKALKDAIRENFGAGAVDV